MIDTEGFLASDALEPLEKAFEMSAVVRSPFVANAPKPGQAQGSQHLRAVIRPCSRSAPDRFIRAHEVDRIGISGSEGRDQLCLELANAG